jgi:hypothetical protein
VGNGPAAVATGYFDGNQTLDLVVINESDNDATILLGNGNGTFTAEATTLALGNNSNPVSVAVADLNGDGIPDLAVATQVSSQQGQVSILLGNGSGGIGNGTFQTPVAYSTGTSAATTLVIGDFNGDGIPDLALASASSGSTPGNLVSLLLGVANSHGTASGTFGAPALFGAGYLSSSLVTGDFNLDGTLDLAVANGGSNAVSILLNTQGTTINFTSSSSQPTYGQSLTLTASVASSVSSGLPVPTGTVTFENGSTVIGTAQTLSGGQASVSTTTLPAGTNSLAAVYSGDPNYQAHTVLLSQTVQVATSSTSLASSVSSATPGQLVTFTATVNAPQPTGTVTFFDGANSIGTGTLSAGQAAFSTTSLAVGTHNITAAYAGNSNISGSTSSILQEVIGNGSTTTPGFTMQLSAFSPATVSPGSPTTAKITITASGGLSPSAVKLACSVAPSATPAATCSVGSISASNTTGTATLTFTSAGPQAALALPNRRGSNRLFAFGFIIPAILLGGAGFTKPGRKKLMHLCLLLALAGCMAHMACGGGSSGSGSGTGTSTGNSGTPAGLYTVTVTGTASGVQSPQPLSTPVTVQ